MEIKVRHERAQGTKMPGEALTGTASPNGNI